MDGSQVEQRAGGCPVSEAGVQFPGQERPDFGSEEQHSERAMSFVMK